MMLQLQPPSILLDILLSIHKHSHQNEEVNTGTSFISDPIQIVSIDSNVPNI